MPSPAQRSLTGLCLGDAFGQALCQPRAQVEGWRWYRTLPPPIWRITDDGVQAGVLLAHLQARGLVESDLLAAELAEAYRQDPYRGYGAGAQALLSAIAAGERWQDVTRHAFGGLGSMGSGAAMRVAPLGALFAEDLARVAIEAEASAVVTHANRNAIAGAIAVAVAAALSARGEALSWETVLRWTPGSLTREGIEAAAGLGEVTVEEAAEVLGVGERLCAHDTVPFALWCVASGPADWADAIWMTAQGGGDMDTTCAIVGGIRAASGVVLPEAWLRRVESIPTGDLTDGDA
ncbi:MAG: ADP-ribosylglycohydrolase [Myxococcota bacterium]|jgi:ADP-ribosylglycohydrolase